MNKTYQQEKPMRKLGIAKQLLISILLISTLFTIFTTCLNLYLDYKEELASIDDRFVQIEESFLSSLVSTLWVEDREQLMMQAEGIMHFPAIHYLEIKDDNGIFLQLGAELPKYMHEKSWDMVYKTTSREYKLATLTVQSDLYVVYQGLWDKFLILLLSQAVEIFVIAVVITLITYRLIVHPLTLMSRSVSEFDDNKVPKPVYLDERWFDDEFITLSQRYNQSVCQIRENYIQLEEAREIAEEANRKKSEFLANMSHEIRTPMNGIIGLSSLMKEMEMPADQKEYISMLHTSSLSLLDLINDILDFSKIEAGRLELEHTALNLFELNKEVESVFMVRAAEKRLAFQCSIDRSITPMLLGDATKLRQVLNNLVSNAIKFTDQGYVHLQIQRENESPESVTVRFEVSDTGIGVPADKHDAIFDKFQQADGSTTRKYGGTGLGLAICREIVRMMGGELKISSDTGKGSTFYFSVILEKNVLPEAEENDRKLLSELNVLLVDDSMLNMRITSAQLSNYGAKSTCCEDAVKAAELVMDALERKQPFDLIVLDKIMPEIDGFDLAQQLRVRFAEQCPKMMMVSAGPEMGDEEKAKQVGIGSYLARPYKESSLKWAVQHVLRASLSKANIDCNEHVSGTQSVGVDYPAPSAETIKQASQPQQMPQQSRAAELGSNQQVGTATGGGEPLPVVLVVEDTAVNQKVAKMMLEKLGVRVEIANNGAEAISRFREQSFDVIFMDCQMPVMDGFAATKAIRAEETEGHRIPIIALTANVVKEEKEKCFAAGMDDFVSKPVSQKMLAVMLEKYLSATAEKLNEYLAFQRD
ncbi:hybrid sensor histidine kinase/response regulator [Photobacterium sp. J15]|uniref:hybrid sensor histidine kinase/response regulator n=1 Tax=Photobacterium sp. J15 TaxID=265901 RepID=UPI0007E465D2|nr:hybrid sensor histidine kinase/response regulator [Photobacterium sp. J15]